MRWLALVALFALPTPAGATPCRTTSFEGHGYTVCEAPASADLRVFQLAADGQPYGSFARIDTALAGEGKTLAFAMNGGMYHPGRAPVGLLIENGTQLAPLVKGASAGNFGLLPNGVLCIGEGAQVIETRRFAKAPRACRYATQSGPMLVIGGKLHPRFIPDSDSRYVRNGVGVSADGDTVVFAISDDAVNFAEFGRFFRDALKTPEALYLDGSISRLYAPSVGRDDFGFPMGPIVGLVVPRG